MNKNQKFSSAIPAIILGLALTFLFVSADWTPPPCRPGAACDQPPPTCPSGTPGCDNPLHIGKPDQTKIGNLTIEGMLDIRNRLRIGSGIPGSLVRAVVSGTPVFLGEIRATAGTRIYYCPPIQGCWGRWGGCNGSITTDSVCLQHNNPGCGIITPNCVHVGYKVGLL